MPVEQIPTRDDLTLAVEHRPLTSPRARLVIVHGYAEHRGRYASLIARLEERGVECHSFDLRGHGESQGARAHVPRFFDYLDDLQRVIATVPNGAPLFLLGHSLGGLIALAYVRAHPDVFDGLVVSSPFLGPAFTVPRVQSLLASIGTVIAPAMKIASPLDPASISRDSDVVAAYRADPRILRVTTPRWYTEVRAAQGELASHAHEIRTPALVLVGGDDRIADHHLALTLFERLGTPAAEKQLRAHQGLYHEVFNELTDAREEVIQDLLSWLESRLQSQAQPAPLPPAR